MPIKAMTLGPVRPLVALPSQPRELRERPEFFREVLPAAFRLDNVIGSVLSQEELPSGDPDPDFQLTKESVAGYEPFIEKLAAARNAEELSAIKRQIDREQQDRAILAQAGASGILASFAAGTLDPVNFIPVGGIIYRGIRTGATIGGLTARAALASTMAASVAESGLQASQRSRPLEESALAVGGAAIVGGILGWAGGAVAARTARRLTEELVSDWSPIDGKINISRADFETDYPIAFTEGEKFIQGEQFAVQQELAPTPGRAADEAAEIQVQQELAQGAPGQRLIEAEQFQVQQELAMGGVQGPHVTPTPDTSVGARMRHGLEARLKSAVGVDKFAAALKMSPVIRTVTATAASVRRMALLAFETPFRIVDNTLGIASPHAVETLVKQWEYPRAQAKLFARDQYNKYARRLREAGQQPVSFEEFRNMVGRAMRRNDQSEVPEVTSTARFYRQKIYDPLKDAMIEQKLLPKGVKPETAASYLNRRYNIPKLFAERQLWRARLRPWLRGAIQQEIRELKKAKKPDRERIRFLESYDDADLDLILDDIAERIGSHPAGRNMYEPVRVKMPKLRGATMERTLDVPDALIEDFLESDIDALADAFIRTTAPDVELARVFDGDPTAERWLGDKEGVGGLIREEYRGLIDAAKTVKEKERLRQEMEDRIRDLSGMIARLRHMHTAPSSASMVLERSSRALRQFNLVTMLGQVVLSSIPDLARPVMVNGFTRAFGAPLKAMMARMAGDADKLRALKSEIDKAGTALDMVLNSRANRLFDIGDEYKRVQTTALERGLERMSSSFGMVSLLSPWNTAMKHWSGIVMMDRILGNAQKIAAGSRLSKRELEHMASLGLDEMQLRAIGKQFAAHGDEFQGLRSPNTDEWDDLETVRNLRAALAKAVDITIVTPGVGDIPFMADHPIGGLILQFRSFSLSAVNRILISGLQARDMAALNGALLTVALGALSFNLKSVISGKEWETDPGVLVAEGIDRGGLLGILSDVNLMVERATRGTIGISPLLTGSEPLSRGVSRRIGDSVYGVSISTLESIAALVGAGAVSAVERDLSNIEVRDWRRLTPYSNLFYLRGLLTAVHEATGNEFVDELRR